MSSCLKCSGGEKREWEVGEEWRQEQLYHHHLRPMLMPKHERQEERIYSHKIPPDSLFTLLTFRVIFLLFFYVFNIHIIFLHLLMNHRHHHLIPFSSYSSFPLIRFSFISFRIFSSHLLSLLICNVPVVFPHFMVWMCVCCTSWWWRRRVDDV